MFSLRTKQITAIDKLRVSLHAGNRRVILYSPTGTGKTELAMHMIHGAIEKGKRAAFVCNRIGLVSQASERFRSAGIEHGVIQGANTTRSYMPVTVCSIDTLKVRGFPEVDLLIIDEAHACPGTKAYISLIKAHSGITIGLSATPFTRGLGRDMPLLGRLFQDIVVATTIQEAISDGYLVDCDIYAPPSGDLDLSKIKTVAGDYHQGQVGEELKRSRKTRVGDIVTHWKRLANNRTTVCFAFDIADSRAIVDRFINSGITAEHIDCYTKDEERASILGRVKSRDTTVISNCAVLAEGWDSPLTSVMINARPTKSLTRWIQMAGRILRPYPGKTRALILDHGGTPHGYPTDDLPLHLDGGKRAKSETKKDEKHPKKCPKCDFIRPVGVHTCPMCGHSPIRMSDVTTINGSLILKKKKQEKEKEYRSKIYRELKYHARIRGYKRGWISHKYRNIFGVWPREVDGEPLKPTDNSLITETYNHLDAQFVEHFNRDD